MADLPMQSQKEFELAARLQKERAQARLQEKGDSKTFYSNEGISDEEASEIKINPPIAPSFPLFIFFLAIVKDLLDFAELTIIGIIISWIVTIIFAIIVFFWAMGKVGPVRKFMIRRLTLMVAIALIPIIGLLPEASIFVLWMHFREVKYIGNILMLLEEAEGAK